MIDLKELETVYIINKDINLFKMLDLAFLRKINNNIKIEIKNIETEDINSIYYLDSDGNYKPIIEPLNSIELTFEEQKELADIIINNIDGTLGNYYYNMNVYGEELKEIAFNSAISLADITLDIFINKAKSNIKFKNYINSLDYTRVILLDSAAPSIIYPYNIGCKWLGEPLPNGKYCLRCIQDEVNESISLMLKFTSIPNFKSINGIYSFKVNENDVSLIFFNKEDAEKFAEKYLK